MLQAARRHNLRRLIVTSTSEVYGSAQFVPITEEHPLVAQSPYAATKTAADQAAPSFHRTFSLPVAVLRPFNTYGPRQSARAVIPTILTQVLGGKREVHVGSIDPTRDFTFAKDTAEGFVKIAIYAALGQVTNIGNMKEISVGDLVKKIGHVLGAELTIISEDQRKRPEASEVERLCADNQKSARLFGWQPRYSLDEGLKLTAAWLEKNAHHYKSGIYNV